MSNTPSLLPCPFCGGINIIHCGHHMYCHACGADGPDADSQHESEAIAAWNRRTPQPVVREPHWIDPNDKTQQQYLPHIGEPVLFCHKGTTYCGKHTGASFVSGVGFAQKHFNTWHCHWMYPPAAHDIAQKGGSNA